MRRCMANHQNENCQQIKSSNWSGQPELLFGSRIKRRPDWHGPSGRNVSIGPRLRQTHRIRRNAIRPLLVHVLRAVELR